MNLVCQACEVRPSSVVERADDAANPYLVCQACHIRLMGRSLRPLEWFNLAKRHGWAQFLLHDDFYDEDGVATQPEDEVDEPWLHPAPSLEASISSADRLLDFSITRWHLDSHVRAAWLTLPVSDVLACLTSRFDVARNPSIRSTILQITGYVGAPAADLVRQAWMQFPESGPFWSLVEATAACLPFEDGFHRCTSALKAMPEKVRREAFPALAHFRSPEVLLWIEANASEPTTEAWGCLAAASAFSWPKAVEWFNAGRPLNLIAIDALLEIAEPRTLFLKQASPRLAIAPEEQAVRQVLDRVMSADPVPRVKQRVAALLARLPALLRLDGT